MSEKNDVNQNPLNKESVDEKVNKENLPVVQKGRLAMLADNLRNNPQTADTLRRIGKIVGYAGLVVAGFVQPFGIPGIIAGPIAITGAVGTVIHSQGKVDKDMMFAIKSNGEIGQTLRPDLIYKTRGLTDDQRKGYMGLQLLIALSREKQRLQNTDVCEELENGSKVYSKQYSTQTHPMNIRLFNQLAKFGYIKIDSCTPALDKNGNKVTSKLTVEKILMGSKNEKKKRQTQDQTQTKTNPVVMYKIDFKVTDKGLDIADLFQKCNDPEFMNKKENEAYRAGFPSVLSVTNPNSPFCPSRDEDGNLKEASVRIDIGKDRFGRDIIVYRAPSDKTKTCSEILLENRQRMSDESNAKSQEEPTKDDPTKAEVAKEESKAEQTQTEANGKENEQRDSFGESLKVGFTPKVPDSFKRTNNDAQIVNRNSQEIDNERE